MFVVKVLEEQNAYKKVDINGYDFYIKKKINFIQDEIPRILQDIKGCLVRYDTVGIASILDEFKELRNILWRCMDRLLQVEFERYCLHLCSYFFNELNEWKVGWQTLLRFMLTGDKSIALNDDSQVIKIEYLREIRTPQRTIQKYLDKRFEEFVLACEKNDIESVRRLSPPFGDGNLIKRIYANEKYVNVFEGFVRKVGEILIEKESALSKTEMVRYIFTGTTSIQEHGNKFNKLKRLDIFQEVASAVYQVIAEKPNSYKILDDVWRIREKNEQGFRSVKLDFSHLSEEDKPYVKMYIHQLISETGTDIRDAYSRLNSIRTIYTRFRELPYEDVKSVFHMNYYHVLHLIDYLQQLRNEKGSQYYTLPTIHGRFIQVRLFIDWVIEEYNWQHDNPFRDIEFHNIKSFSQTTDYIPEVVIEKLEKVLYELPEIHRNAWEIMMNGGLRFSDIQSLGSDCITYEEREQCYVLTYVNQKMKKQKIRNGESIYHIIPASEAVIEAVKRQKELTADLRTIANTERLFVVWNGSAVVSLEGKNMQRAINRLLKKYDIRDDNGEIYHYANHQCRKTLIVDLLSQGLSLGKVADFIGHSEQTLARHYRDVQKQKIAELDSKMFEQLFGETLDEEVKEQYTEEEKAALIREVKLGARETPEGHGTCVKHVSFGPCRKKKCAGCKLLITGPQKLPKWYQLYSEQEQYIKELEQEYQQAGVEDCKEHRSYQAQVHLLDVYRRTIEKIENWAKQRGIPIEQYRQG